MTENVTIITSAISEINMIIGECYLVVSVWFIVTIIVYRKVTKRKTHNRKEAEDKQDRKWIRKHHNMRICEMFLIINYGTKRNRLNYFCLL